MQEAMVYGKNTRLTAKPVQLPTTTGVFLMRAVSSRVSRMACGAEGRGSRVSEWE